MQYLLPLKLLPVALLIATLVPLLVQPQTTSLEGEEGGVAPSETELRDVLLTRFRRWLWGGKEDDNDVTPAPAADEEEEEEEELIDDTIPTTSKPSRWKKWWMGFKTMAGSVGSAVKEEAVDMKDALKAGAKMIKVKIRRGYNKTKKGFRIVKLKVKKGFNMTKESLKAAVRSVKRIFTKEEKFSIFANNLKDKVEAGDVQAIKFLEKLGIGLAFEGGKINSTSIREGVNVVEMLNKEGLAKPAVTEEEEEEGEGREEEADEEEENEESSKEELIEGPDIWNDTVECSTTCELNKAGAAPEVGGGNGHGGVPEDPTPTEANVSKPSVGTTQPTTATTISMTTSTAETTTTLLPITTTPSTTSTTTTVTTSTTSTSTTTIVPTTTTSTTTTPSTITIPSTTTPSTTTIPSTTTKSSTTTATTEPTTTTISTTTTTPIPTTTTSTTTTTTTPTTLPPSYYNDTDYSEIIYPSSAEDLGSAAGEDPPPFPDIFSDDRVKDRLWEFYEHGDLTHESLHDIFNFDPNNYEDYYDTTLSE